MIRRRVSVLGSTGSVGSSTLDLMDQAEAGGAAAFEGEALTGGSNIARLAEQARRWKPRVAVTADAARLDELRDALAGTDVAAAAGEAAAAPSSFSDESRVHGEADGESPWGEPSAARLPDTLSASLVDERTRLPSVLRCSCGARLSG